MKRVHAGSLAAALFLVLGCLVAVGPPSAAAAAGGRTYPLPVAGPTQDGPTLAKDGTVLRRTASFTEANRATGMTPPEEPWLQFRGATFSLDLDDRDFFGEVTLGAAPPSGEAVYLVYVVGVLQGNNCETTPFTPVHDVSQLQHSNAAEDLPAGWENANCAVALLSTTPSAGNVVDALVGPLVDELPALSITRAELLDSKKLRLVRGVWTKIDVEVTNAGPGVAGDVEVTGKGKGLKVRPGRVGFGVGAGSKGTAEIQVKLVGKKPKAKLELTAAFGPATASDRVVVRRIPPPAAPHPGSYESAKGGDVTFRVTKGRPKLVGFRVRTQTTCGGSGTIPTHTMNTYDFPRTSIPRNGIVDAVDRVSDLYTVSLRFRIVGGKVTKGRFDYSAPGPCRATEVFTAKRVGR